jgi:ubiquinone biosynthesis protein COQ4
VYAVDRAKAVKHLALWLSNPVSVNGPRNLLRAKFAAGAPMLEKQVAEMRVHPDGRRILADRPDLARALSDMEALRALPPGSLGRAYHDFMSDPAALPTYLLGSFLFENGDFDRLDWSDEMRYVAVRDNHTHDLTHVISGYGTHLTQEAVNINFNVGLAGAPRVAAQTLTGLFWLIALPSAGWRPWYDLHLTAWERGAAMRATIPFHCVYWEELLPLPIEDVRSRLGIPELVDVPETSGWMRSPLGKAMADGYGGAGDRAAKARHVALAEALGGLDADPRDLAVLPGLPAPLLDRLGEALEAGASEAELRELAGLPARAVSAA